jgi:nucleotide-binding universal stress UspA family protein
MSTLPSRTPLRIELAIDGSAHSYAAAQLIHDLALPPKSVVMALGVLTPRNTPGRAALQEALERAQAILGQREGVCVETGLLHGQPAEALARFAQENKPDLIAAGAVGLRATLGILLGGVVQQLVEYAERPVLAVRTPYNGLRRVLLVTDGSPYSMHAQQFLARFPIEAGTAIDVLHVLPPPWTPVSPSFRGSLELGVIPPQAYPIDAETAAQEAEIEERTAHALLAGAVEGLANAGIQATGTLARGDAATEILAFAAQHQTDLIVAGSRGLGAVTGWLLGSVSRKLVHYARCSVVIVKTSA